MTYKVAGIDVHKKVLMVVVADAAAEQETLESRRFGTGAGEREHLAAWLRERGVQQIVMESTAQYWKPIWQDLEPHFPQLHLAQAQSNRAPKGRKHDFGDAQRLLRRLLAGELILSFVPDPEQRQWRTITRTKVQLVRDRVRLHNQMEALLEEARIKLSSVVSELLGLSGLRILRALAKGQTDPVELAKLGDRRLKCSQQDLADALRGHLQPCHRELLELFLERLDLVDRQAARMDQMAGAALRAHEDAVLRLARVPGFGPDSAQQLIAEVGPYARPFDSSAQFASWAGLCPGRQESAEHNHSARCAKGNPFLRRILTQAAQAAVKTKGSHFQKVFRRWLTRMGYQRAIWAIAHKLGRVVWKILHDQVHYLERGQQSDPAIQRRRANKMIRALQAMGYQVEISSLNPQPVQG